MAARNGKEDYYKILGLSRDCTQSDVKRAFRALAKEKHPDVSKDPNASAVFKKISEAYEVLSDPEKRKIYDAYGHDGLNGAAGSGFEGFQQGSYSSGFGNINDFFEDILGDLFGGRKKNQSYANREQNQKGNNYLKNIVISFKDAVLGIEKYQLELNIEIPCTACNQSGAATPQDLIVCSSCNGNGIREVNSQSVFGSIRQQVVCNNCSGTGKIIRNKCLKCKGNRFYSDKQKLQFRIPPSTFTGDILTIKGRGGVPRNSKGPQGDLLIKIAVTADKYFQLHNNHDLMIHLPISYLDTIIGKKVKIPTIDGKIIEKELKPGIQNGDVIEIANEGCYRSSNTSYRGKLIIVLDVIVPKKITRSEREIIAELDKITSFAPNADFISEFEKYQKKHQ